MVHGEEIRKMKIEIVGDSLVLTVPLNRPLAESKTGKSLNLYTSNGIVQTAFMHEGQSVSVGLNVFVKNPNYVDPKKK